MDSNFTFIFERANCVNRRNKNFYFVGRLKMARRARIGGVGVLFEAGKKINEGIIRKIKNYLTIICWKNTFLLTTREFRFYLLIHKIFFLLSFSLKIP